MDPIASIEIVDRVISRKEIVKLSSMSDRKGLQQTAFHWFAFFSFAALQLLNSTVYSITGLIGLIGMALGPP